MVLTQEKVLFTVPLFLAVWLSAWMAIAFPLVKKLQWRPFQIIAPEKKLILLMPLYLLAPLIVWGALVYLGQSWSEIGVIPAIRSVRSLAYGLGIAIGGIALLLGLKSIFQLFIPHQPENTSVTKTAESKLVRQTLAILGFLALGLWIGGIEELVFRGWLQTQLELAFTPWMAASIGSILFAVAHLVWDGRPGLWQQPGLWLLGWVLVIARWADGGNLALAWGLHAGWVGSLAYISEFLKSQPVAKNMWLLGRPGQPLTGGLDFLLMGVTAGLVWWNAGGFP
ncbi:MAG: CPBP family intramembrane glutamic endopeptidase [Cyanobacteria bacterium P01_F01_bin.86]